MSPRAFPFTLAEGPGESRAKRFARSPPTRPCASRISRWGGKGEEPRPVSLLPAFRLHPVRYHTFELQYGMAPTATSTPPVSEGPRVDGPVSVGGKTMANQDKLPHLPIPPLEETMQRYLKALEGLQVSTARRAESGGGMTREREGLRGVRGYSAWRERIYCTTVSDCCSRGGSSARLRPPALLQLLAFRTGIR